MEALIVKKQVKLEKLLENQELAMLILLLKQPPENEADSLQIKMTILKIIHFVYLHKFLKSQDLPMLNYSDKLKSISTGKLVEGGEMHSPVSREENAKVLCVLELEETFEILIKVISDFKDDVETIAPLMLNLMHLYSQSKHKKTACFITKILPLTDKLFEYVG